MKQKKSNYITLVLLALLFAAPGIAAYVFYLNPQWLGSSTTNQGQFVSPAVRVDFLANHQSRWNLVFVSPTACEKDCIEQVDRLARVRLALGRKLYSVQQSLVVGPDAILPESYKTRLADQDVRLFLLPKNLKNEILILKDQPRVYIANPDGFLVLEFKPDAKSGSIFHDLKQLINTTEKTST